MPTDPRPASRFGRAPRPAALALRFAVTAGVLVFLFRRVDLGSVAKALSAAEQPPVFAAFALSLALQALTAWRLLLLTRAQGLRVGGFEVFSINLSALFYGLFLPGGSVTAMGVRFYKLTRPARGLAEERYTGTMAAMLCDRAAAAAALGAVGVLFLALDSFQNRAHEFSGGLLALFAGATALFVALALPFFHEGASRAMLRIARKPRLLARSLRAWRRARDGASPSMDATATPGSTAALAAKVHFPVSVAPALFALSAGAQLLGIAAFYLLARAIGIDLPFITLGWIRSAAILVTMIPVSVSGLGLREGSLLVLLRPAGVVTEEAIAFSLLVFAVTVVGVGLVGGALEGLRYLSREGVSPRAPSSSAAGVTPSSSAPPTSPAPPSPGPHRRPRRPGHRRA